MASVLSATESVLFERVNCAMPADRRARYEALRTQRETATLTSAEHDELLHLSDELEALDADRVTAIAELARLRGVSLDAMMSALGMPARR